jgi:hypothetical protein
MRSALRSGGTAVALAAALAGSVATASPAAAAGEHVRNDGSSVVPLVVSYDFTDLDGRTTGDAQRSLAPGETLIGKTFGSGSAMNLNFARVPGGFSAEVKNSVVGSYIIDRCDKIVQGIIVEGKDAEVALYPEQANIIVIRHCPPISPA